MDHPVATTNQARTVFVVRDADALGIDFAGFADGYVVSASLPGVGGIYPKDQVLQSPKHRLADTLVGELLLSSENSVTLRVIEHGGNRPATATGNGKRAQRLCAKQKYSEAQLLFALAREGDALALANESACLQLAGGEDGQALALTKRIIDTYPGWEMGYVRQFSCLGQRGDWHGAIRALALGLRQLPNNLCMLRRLAGLDLLRKENGLVCLLDLDPELGLSLSRSAGTVNLLLNGGDEGESKFDLARGGSQFHLLIPANSIPILVNGMRPCDVPEDYSPLVFLVVWKFPEPNTSTVSASASSSSLVQLSPATVIPIELTKPTEPPTQKDTVQVSGSGIKDCNRIFYPQGLRNEKAWFENAKGYSLSYEQSSSGLCGWVLGRNKQEVVFVLRPGLDPQGPGGEWIAAMAADQDLAVPLYVGANSEKGWTSPQILQWLEEEEEKDGEDKGEEVRTEQLVALKGHAIQLFEGGWYEEAKSLLQVCLKYKSMNATYAHECEFWLQEAEEETRLFLQAAGEEEDAEAMEGLSLATTAKGEQVQPPLQWSVAKSQMDRVVFNLIEMDTGKSFQFKFEKNLLLMMAKVDKRQLWFCCCAAPPPSTDVVSFHPQDVAFSFEDGEDGEEEEEEEQGATRLRITRLTSGVKQYFSFPPPPIVKLLKAWKQFGG
ncbi:hypothetical protein BASA81_001454 [Batrachochytrium salamandrivorans]|nr:hypothetical protein BASA81_001454 [Batrachochytrium salamandrivorans]